MNPVKDQFLLDPSITFLNFGSFGACPKIVFEEYQRLQRQLEFEPVQFIVHDGVQLLARSREALGKYVSCSPDDLVYVTNPSYAINTIAKSFPLEVGDEILTTNLEYGAMDRTWNYYCRQKGAKYVQSRIELPIASKEAFIEDFWKGYSSSTKAIFISQITSSTGLILPVKEICEEAKNRGLITIVDGAHVPGHIDLNISELEADIYTGACHKWMMAPKGSSFLYVTKEHQHWVDPLLISWGYDSDFPSYSQFLDYHQMNGTRDYSAFLTVPKAIEFMEVNKWKELTAVSRDVAISQANRFCNLMNSTAVSPIDEVFLGQMFSIPVNTADSIALYRALYDQYRIEIPVATQNGNSFVRYSIQPFTDIKELDHLYQALSELKEEGKLILGGTPQLKW